MDVWNPLWRERFFDNNEPKFVSLVSDTTFKYLWKNVRTSPWIRDIVEAKTGIDLSDYHLSDSEWLLELVLRTIGQI